MARPQICQSKMIFRFISKHGDRYDYSKVAYCHIQRPIIIGCSIHGDFHQTAAAHLAGSGCQKCAAVNQSWTTDLFLEKSKGETW